MKIKQLTIVLLVIMLASMACEVVIDEPTAIVTPTPYPAPTDTPGSTGVPAPTDATTPAPTDAPSPPTAEPAPTETEPPPDDELAILSFTVTVEDGTTGKRLIFNWQTTGAVSCMIYSGTHQRFPDAWEVPVNGTYTVDNQTTHYRDPIMSLTATDAGGNSVSASATADWDCAHDYFFPTDIALCPIDDASSTWAAEQAFENGRMIWLEQVESGAVVYSSQILVLYDDGTMVQYQDTWTEGMPESDPSLTPPAGLQQPIRGFGKVWRDNSDVQTNLGWALADEQGFDTLWQMQIQESIGSGSTFLQSLNGQILRINGWGMGGGSWEVEQ